MCIFGRRIVKMAGRSRSGTYQYYYFDIALGDDDGIAIAKEIRSKYPQIKVILLSGYAQLASNVFEADPVYFLFQADR